MPIELTLTFVDQSGCKRQLVTSSSRVTLGRGADNDVVIDDSNLSRQHAVIEKIGESFQVADYNSRNGTTVNGHPMVGPVALYDGDVINLAGASDVSVAFKTTVSQNRIVTASVPVIAGTTVVVIVLVFGLLFATYAFRKRATKSDNTNVIAQQNKDFRVAEPSPSTATKDADAKPDGEVSDADADSTEQRVRAVKRVMSKLSNDSAPYISDTGIRDVSRKIDEYRGSSELRERLRAAKLACPQITTQAQHINLKSPLLMYAVLADSEAGADPSVAARKMVPRLLTLRATFGTETSNSALLLVAAYPYPFNPSIGSQARTPHPLASKLMEFGGRKSTVETTEARSVWFLREKNGITSEAYDLVIRLLAIGVIAQNPKQYGIEAEPPLC